MARRKNDLDFSELENSEVYQIDVRNAEFIQNYKLDRGWLCISNHTDYVRVARYFLSGGEIVMEIDQYINLIK